MLGESGRKGGQSEKKRAFVSADWVSKAWRPEETGFGSRACREVKRMITKEEEGNLHN